MAYCKPDARNACRQPSISKCPTRCRRECRPQCNGCAIIIINLHDSTHGSQYFFLDSERLMQATCRESIAGNALSRHQNLLMKSTSFNRPHLVGPFSRCSSTSHAAEPALYQHKPYDRTSPIVAQALQQVFGGLYTHCTKRWMRSGRRWVHRLCLVCI